MVSKQMEVAALWSGAAVIADEANTKYLESEQINIKYIQWKFYQILLRLKKYNVFLILIYCIFSKNTRGLQRYM